MVVYIDWVWSWFGDSFFYISFGDHDWLFDEWGVFAPGGYHDAP